MFNSDDSDKYKLQWGIFQGKNVCNVCVYMYIAFTIKGLL